MASITVYMIINGTPALFKVGIMEILFGTVWQPAAKDPSFGILYVILTSIVGTTAAVLLGAPVGNFNGGIHRGDCISETGSRGEAGSGALSRDPVGDLWPSGDLSAESADV